MMTGPRPPAGAAFFSIYRLRKIHGRNKETGREWNGYKAERLQGDVDARTGQVAELWPVSSFSTQAVLARWGSGRYRIWWHDAAGVKLPGSIKQFVLQAQSPKGKRQADPTMRPEDDGDPRPSGPTFASTPGMGLGPFELLQMLDERAERAAASARSDAERQAERDRAFFASIQQQQAQMLAFIVKEKNAAAASPGFDANLIRREMNVTIREGLQQMRQEIGTLIPETGGDDDDEPPPADMGEATERMGIELVGELSRQAPGLLQEAIPAFWQFLTKRGYKPSPKMQRRIDKTIAARQAAEEAAARVTASMRERQEEEEEPEDIEDEDNDGNAAHSQ